MNINNDGPILRYEDAVYAYCLGNFKEASAIFSELVQLNYAQAATYLGQMYIRGEGVVPNIEKGLQLLKLAASWGDGTAAFSLGAYHRSGAGGVPVNLKESRHFFLLAKELGTPLPVEDYL